MRTGRRGSALLAVLWLTAALAAIAFTVAASVRAETERASTDSDALRSYYLATGAIDRALLYIEWGPGHRNPDGTPRYYEAPMPAIRMQFPTGEASVEVIQESSKLNVNDAPGDQLFRLLSFLGSPPERARDIALGILDWRAPSQGGGFTGFDQYYLSLAPSFRSRHASFEEIEELLLIRGVTPDLFYGGYTRDAQSRLVPRPGLRDCLSVYGSSGAIDVNGAEVPVLEAIGVDPGAAVALAEVRRRMPIRSMDQLAPFAQSGPGFSRLAMTRSTMITLRATARLRLADGRLSDLRRSAAAMVKLLGAGYDPPFHVMRWYDNAFSPR
jgi:general secretion pathway protein K